MNIQQAVTHLIKKNRHHTKSPDWRKNYDESWDTALFYVSSRMMANLVASAVQLHGHIKPVDAAINLDGKTISRIAHVSYNCAEVFLSKHFDMPEAVSAPQSQQTELRTIERVNDYGDLIEVVPELTDIKKGQRWRYQDAPNTVYTAASDGYWSSKYPGVSQIDIGKVETFYSEHEMPSEKQQHQMVVVTKDDLVDLGLEGFGEKGESDV